MSHWSLLNSCNPGTSSRRVRRRRVQWWSVVRDWPATFHWRECESTQDFPGAADGGSTGSCRCGGGQNQETGGEEPAGEASVAPVTSQDINEKDRADLAQGGEIRLDVAEFGTTWNVFSVNGNNDDMAHAMLPASPIWFNIDAKGVATPNPDYLYRPPRPRSHRR